MSLLVLGIDQENKPLPERAAWFQLTLDFNFIEEALLVPDIFGKNMVGYSQTF